MKPWSHRLAATSIAWAAAVCTGLMPSGAGAQTGLAGDPPDLVLWIEMDPANGAFEAETVMEAPLGDVQLPQAEWLTIETIRVGSEAPLSDLPPDSVLGADVHRGQDIHLRLAGHLPAPVAEMTAVAAGPEATHIVGPVWFPTDAAAVRDHLLTVRVPEGQRSAGTGAQGADAVAGGWRETEVTFTGFSTDLGLFIGPYDMSETRHGDLPLRTYFETADPELSERYFTALAAYLDRYEAEIGAYPYGGFSVVSAPRPVGLGFAGLTYVSRDILSHSYMTGRSLAHEVLHSWWGNAVGIDYATGNWAEGLTTYQADYALAEDEGLEAARAMRIGWIRALDALDAESERPLTAFRSTGHDRRQAEGYGKAAMVFRMLEDEIGAEAFSAGIQAFYTTHRNTVAGWQDLRSAFEQASGRELGWFFDQWIGRPGLPNIHIEAATARVLADGSTELSISLRQEGPPYRLRVPLVFEMPSGHLHRMAEIAGPSETLVISLPEMPAAVLLDPDFEIARRPLSGELAPILRALSASDAVLAMSTNADGAAEGAISAALDGLLGETDLLWNAGAVRIGPLPSLIAGSAAQVAEARPAYLGQMPDLPEAATRLWVERDEQGRLWAFLTFDAPEALATDLRSLRFYATQSYLAVSEGRAVGAGVWANVRSAVAVPATGPVVAPAGQ